MMHRTSFWLLIAASLAGCASAPLTLTTEDLAYVKKVHLVCVVPQEGLEAQSESFSTQYYYTYFPGVSAPTNTGMNATFGSVQEITNAIRTAHAYRIAQKHIAELKRRVADIDYRKEICGRVGHSASQVKGKVITRISIRSDVPTESEETEIAGSMIEDALLTMKVSYSLQLPSHAVLEVVTDTRMVLKRNPTTVWNLGRYVYLSESVDASQIGVPVNAWADRNARLYRAAVRQSIDETIGMLRADFLDPYAPENRVTDEVVHINLQLSGQALQKSSNNPHRQVFRAGRTWYSGPRLNTEGGELEALATAGESGISSRPN